MAFRLLFDMTVRKMTRKAIEFNKFLMQNPMLKWRNSAKTIIVSVTSLSDRNTHFCRIRDGGGAGRPPSPIIFEERNLPQQTIHH